MFDHTHYIPILKGRMGEYGALETLSLGVKRALTPLIEIPPIPWDWKKEQPKKSIDAHLQEVGSDLDKSWASDQPFFVDLLWISEDDRMVNGGHPLEFVFGAIRDWTLNAIPVVGLVRSEEFARVCRSVQNQDKRGICLRIQREDFIEFGNVETQVFELLERLSVSVRDTDLILDLRSIIPPNEVKADAVIGMVQSIPRLREWRSFAITGTSFPPNLMGLPPEEASVIDRTEWTLWLELTRRVRELPRRPTFGDYAISHPEPAEVDPRKMRPSASIRYTAERCWLVLKGRNVRDHGFKEFRQVSRELIASDEYSGSSFSWGDNYIEQCAAQRTGTGNLTTWRKVGTSHHLTFAVRQLANLYGS